VWLARPVAVRPHLAVHGPATLCCTICPLLIGGIDVMYNAAAKIRNVSRRLFNVRLSDPLGSVDWGAASQQASKLVTLFFVVSFGSSLDISAIQADLPVPIDYNAELQTVGACYWPSGAFNHANVCSCVTLV